VSQRQVPSGSSPEPRTIGPVTQTDIVRFAGAGGDFNPLHHDPEVAVRAGFERPIAMGQLTAGLAAAWLTDWCGVENLRSLTVRFVAPLHIGETLTLAATPAAEQPETGLVHLDIVATVGDRSVLVGSCRVRAD
jgi:3-hydroxybutyryl-CoA dehydratase